MISNQLALPIFTFRHDAMDINRYLPGLRGEMGKYIVVCRRICCWHAYHSRVQFLHKAVHVTFASKAALLHFFSFTATII